MAMGKIVKGIVLGAVVGGGIRAAQDLRSEDDLGAIAPRVAKTAGEAALAGAAVGIVLSARDRRRRKKMARSATNVAKLRALAETGVQVAVPALQHAAESARPHVVHAVDEARVRAHELSEAARPRVESASKRARQRYEHELERARPKVERAAREAREKVADVADLASERAKRTLSEHNLPTTIIAV